MKAPAREGKWHDDASGSVTETKDDDVAAHGDDPAKWWVFDDVEDLTTRFEAYLSKQEQREESSRAHQERPKGNGAAKRPRQPTAEEAALARPTGYSFSACGQFLDALIPGLSKSASDGSLFADANKKESAAVLVQRKIRESKLPTHAQLQQRAKEKLARIRLDELKQKPLPDARAWRSAGPSVRYGDGPPHVSLDARAGRPATAQAHDRGAAKSPLRLRQSARARVAAKIEARRRAEEEGPKGAKDGKADADTGADVGADAGANAASPSDTGVVDESGAASPDADEQETKMGDDDAAGMQEAKSENADAAEVDADAA